MGIRKEEQLHIRCSKKWLNKLDHLVKLEGGTRTSYIKHLVEERYDLEQEISGVIARSMEEASKNGKSGED